MAGYTAADVKRLRDETDAPMMECKSALEDAGGDFERAKEILREKGKAAAAKRSGRSTAAGVVAFATNSDNTVVGGVVVETETDFVARNEDFVALAQKLAEVVRDSEQVDDKKLEELAHEGVAKMRENIRVARHLRIAQGKPVMTYVHHDRTKGAAVVIEGQPSEELRKVAIQAVAFPPEVLSKDQLSQEHLDREIELETRRAMEEGKPENIAKNIAQGRVNKEYIKRVVLSEQPFYTDPNKTVDQYVAETGKGSKIADFAYLAVGQGS